MNRGDRPRRLAKSPTPARRAAPAPPRAWQRMLSGRKLDLLDPSWSDIEITDIAHGLARVARWNGQTRGEHPFSVAQHCLLVVDLVETVWPRLPQAARLAALLHDAAEYVIGDMISPFKAALGVDYRAFEARLETAIHVRFGLPAALPEDWRTAIKEADKMSAYLEATELANFDLAEANLYFKPPPKRFCARLDPMPPVAAQSAYLAAYERLKLPD